MWIFKEIKISTKTFLTSSPTHSLKVFQNGMFWMEFRESLLYDKRAIFPFPSRSGNLFNHVQFPIFYSTFPSIRVRFKVKMRPHLHRQCVQTNQFGGSIHRLNDKLRCKRSFIWKMAAINFSLIFIITCSIKFFKSIVEKFM